MLFRSRAGYYQRKQQQEALEGDKIANLVAGAADKLGIEYVNDRYGIEFAEPTETRAAATTNPAKPRALKIAYIKDTSTLLIQYRDGTICEYADVPTEMWQDLKVTDSTGKYIDSSGIYSMPYKITPKGMFPEEVRVLFD